MGTVREMVAERSGLALRVGLALLWWLLIPFLFFTLYAAAQLQAAAKEVAGQGVNVPNIRVLELSRALNSYDAHLVLLQNAKYDEARKLNEAGRKYTSTKHQLRVRLMEVSADDPVDQGLSKCASRDETIGCFERAVIAARRRLVDMPEPRAGQLRDQIKTAETLFVEFLNLSTETYQRGATLEELRGRMDRAIRARNALAKKNPALTTAAATYDEILKQMPWLDRFFMLPDGAVTGLFTGVMGALGAVVFSVYGRLRDAGKNGGMASESLFQSYITRPLLGGLAGFMIYFAISAGSGALFEAGSVAHADAGGALSPAALATLGLFAGLAAENALQWLAEKARGLFPLDKPDPAGGDSA